MSYLFLAPHKYRVEVTQYGDNNLAKAQEYTTILVKRFGSYVKDAKVVHDVKTKMAVMTFCALAMPLTLVQAFEATGYDIRRAVLDLD